MALAAGLTRTRVGGDTTGQAQLGCRALKDHQLPASPSIPGASPGMLLALTGTVTPGLKCIPIHCCQSRNKTKTRFLRKHKVSTQLTAFWLHASQL